MIYKLYIGSNNKTKRLELSKIKKEASKNFEGFTLYQATGYWKGKKEATAILEVETKNKALLADTIKSLKTVLNQEAIGLQCLPSLSFV